MVHQSAVINTPLGPMRAEAEDGFLTRLVFAPDAAADETSLVFPLDALKRQLDDYFSGALRAFSLPMRPDGTPFQHAVWQRLREIPYGETTTYGKLAAQLGMPRAARAVGMALNKNPLHIIVPCHRVLGVSGKLTGYAGGLSIKAALLKLEKNAGNNA